MNCCPFCRSLKIMAEVHGSRIAMVCQKCLARGPECDYKVGREDALLRWNDRRNFAKHSRVQCPSCGKIVSQSQCGLWPHRDERTGKRCAVKKD